MTCSSLSDLAEILAKIATRRGLEIAPDDRQKMEFVLDGLPSLIAGREVPLAAWSAGQHAKSARDWCNDVDRELRGASAGASDAPVRARIIVAVAGIAAAVGRLELVAALERSVALADLDASWRVPAPGSIGERAAWIAAAGGLLQAMPPGARRRRLARCVLKRVGEARRSEARRGLRHLDAFHVGAHPVQATAIETLLEELDCIDVTLRDIRVCRAIHRMQLAIAWQLEDWANPVLRHQLLCQVGWPAVQEAAAHAGRWVQLPEGVLFVGTHQLEDGSLLGYAVMRTPDGPELVLPPTRWRNVSERLELAAKDFDLNLEAAFTRLGDRFDAEELGDEPEEDPLVAYTRDVESQLRTFAATVRESLRSLGDVLAKLSVGSGRSPDLVVSSTVPVLDRLCWELLPTPCPRDSRAVLGLWIGSVCSAPGPDVLCDLLDPARRGHGDGTRTLGFGHAVFEGRDDPVGSDVARHVRAIRDGAGMRLVPEREQDDFEPLTDAALVRLLGDRSIDELVLISHGEPGGLFLPRTAPADAFAGGLAPFVDGRRRGCWLISCEGAHLVGDHAFDTIYSAATSLLSVGWNPVLTFRGRVLVQGAIYATLSLLSQSCEPGESAFHRARLRHHHLGPLMRGEIEDDDRSVAVSLLHASVHGP